MSYVFTTKISKEESINRIKRSTKELSHWAKIRWLFNHDTEFFSKISGDRVKIEKAIISQNSGYTPYFKGTLERVSGGTRYKGDFSSGLVVTLFIVIWFVLLLVIGSVFVSSAVQSGDVLMLVFPFFMALIGIYNMLIIRNQRVDIEKRTIEFIERTLEAKAQRIDG